MHVVLYLLFSYLNLYDLGGKLVAYNDDTSSGNLDSRINFSSEYSGNYYVSVESFKNRYKGNYSLSLQLISSSPSDLSQNNSNSINSIPDQLDEVPEDDKDGGGLKDQLRDWTRDMPTDPGYTESGGADPEEEEPKISFDVVQIEEEEKPNDKKSMEYQLHKTRLKRI